MTVYRRPGSRVWWMDFTAAGTRTRQSTGTQDKAAARQVEAAARLDAKRSRAQPSRWRLRHLFGSYWEGRAAHSKSAATLKYQLAALSDGLGPNLFVADLTSAAIARYVEQRRIARVIEKDGEPDSAVLRANASINRELQALRAALNYAEEIHDQPIPRIKWKGLILKEPPVRIRYLEFADYQRLLDACLDDEMRLMVMLACTSGLRRENLRQVTWEQIDLIHGRISVIAKGGKNFQVKLSGSPLAALQRHAAETLRTAQAGAQASAQAARLTGLAFTRPNWRRRWEAARKAAGLTNYRWHDNRHTFATWARSAGVDLLDLKDAMNHSTIQMTTKYAHITADQGNTAWDAVANRLEAQAKTKGKSNE